ncbi:MAG: RNA methyltransferase [Leptospiraceae bacterium]|nr:RNA methyltransferase [Leptospiraceae bacterium]
MAAKELESLGAKNIREDFTGIHFTGNLELLYRVNLWTRIIFRVLVQIREFRCSSAKMLYQEVQKTDWSEYLTPKQTLAVNCTGTNSQLNNTHYTALQVKNAIVDQQRIKFGKRSDVDADNPDLMLHLHVHKHKGVLSLDSSASSLHRRGYRPAMGKAPLKETLAAAILDMVEYTPEVTFLDPLCGSGTLPLEAGLKALNIAPGLYREKFGFMSWQNFDPPLWDRLVKEAKSQKKSELIAPILGSDRDEEVIRLAQINAGNCGLEQMIKFAKKEIESLEAPADTGILVCNPPYGQRMGEETELGDFYKLLGDIFKQRFKGWTAYILTGNKELAKRIGLRATKRIPVLNGSIPCTLLKYELY